MINDSKLSSRSSSIKLESLKPSTKGFVRESSRKAILSQQSEDPWSRHTRREAKFNLKWEGPQVIKSVQLNGAYWLINQNGQTHDAYQWQILEEILPLMRFASGKPSSSKKYHMEILRSSTCQVNTTPPTTTSKSPRVFVLSNSPAKNRCKGILTLRLSTAKRQMKVWLLSPNEIINNST